MPGEKINERSLKITGAELSFLQSQEHPDLVESQIRPRGDSLLLQDQPKAADLARVESPQNTTLEASFGVSGQRRPWHEACQPLPLSR